MYISSMYKMVIIKKIVVAFWYYEPFKKKQSLFSRPLKRRYKWVLYICIYHISCVISCSVYIYIICN